MSNTLGTKRGHIYLNVISSVNCDSSQSSIGHENDGWTMVGIVIVVVVCFVVGTSLIWVTVIYHMRKKNEDYSITNTEELNLLQTFPVTCLPKELCQNHRKAAATLRQAATSKLMPPASGYGHKGPDSGTATRVICSDCYNANIYSRTQEHYAYTYITEEDVLDQALSSLMVQLPKETFVSHLPQDATVLEILISSADRERSPFPSHNESVHEKKFPSTQTAVIQAVFILFGFLVCFAFIFTYLYSSSVL